MGEVTQLQPENLEAEMDRLRELSDKAEAGDKAARSELRQLVQRASPAAIAEASSVARKSEGILIKTISAGEPLLQEALQVRLQDMRSEIAGANATALEALLVDRVVAGWLLVEVLEALISAQYGRDVGKGARSSPAYLLQQSKILESATRRHMQAIQTLARVRKLQANTPRV